MIIYIIQKKEVEKMKKLTALFLAAFVLCTFGNCVHVHTTDCGEDGINCTHQCVEIMPCGDGMYPI